MAAMAAPLHAFRSRTAPMNFSQFFIRRPIFAAVLSLIILIGGAISLFQDRKSVV